MRRVIKEQVDFSGEEKGKFDYVRGMLANFINEIEEEVTCPLYSNLLLDTKCLLNNMDEYSRKYKDMIMEYLDECIWATITMVKDYNDETSLKYFYDLCNKSIEDYNRIAKYW